MHLYKYLCIKLIFTLQNFWKKNFIISNVLFKIYYFQIKLSFAVISYTNAAHVNQFALKNKAILRKYRL